MGLWYLSHRRPANAQASLRIRAVSPEPLLFAHMKYGSRRRVQPKIRHLAPLDGCACAFNNEFTEDEKCHNLISWLKCIIISFDCLNNVSDKWWIGVYLTHHRTKRSCYPYQPQYSTDIHCIVSFFWFGYILTWHLINDNVRWTSFDYRHLERGWLQGNHRTKQYVLQLKILLIWQFIWLLRVDTKKINILNKSLL